MALPTENYLSADKLTKTLGERVLFRDISFGVNRGQRVALVGANGSGKSTLLSLIMGDQIPDSGDVRINKSVRVGYLPQRPLFEANVTIEQYIFSSQSPAIQAIRKYEQLLEEEAPDPNALQEAMDEIDSLGAWDSEGDVKNVLAKLGIKHFDQQVTTLSGGQQKRLALARLFIEKPDLLILDEPTNHLDVPTIEWIESYINRSQMSLLMVTHDRYFLDAVCNEIIELNHHTVTRHLGNYAYFLEQKAGREERAVAEADKARNLLRKELEWMRRQPKARGTKSKARIDAFYDLEGKAKGPRSGPELNFTMAASRQGGKILEIEDVSKSYSGNLYVDGFTYTFVKKDRIGIVGPNGAGKSTLLRMIMGLEKPDKGRVRYGETTEIGYYSQEDMEFEPGMRVLEAVQEVAERIMLGDGKEVSASQFLQRFGFEPARQHTPINKLSGGERRRLHLMRVLVKQPNLLILDEPTNDLDIDTLNVLEEFLADFPGSLLIVSHDRYFMDKVIEHTFAFEGEGKVRDFPGNYTEYREWKAEREAEAAQEAEMAKKRALKAPVVVVESQPVAPTKSKTKLSFKEQRELETLEAEMAEMETKKTQMVELLNAGSNHTELAQWAAEIKAIENALSERELRWLELSE